MQLALSTSWFRIDKVLPEEMIATLVALGIEAVELDYRLSEDYLKKLKAGLKKRGIEIKSVHNYFPWPAESPQPGGDVFSLASLDREEWERAIKYTIRTIREAFELEARVVVLHLGEVNFNEGKEFYRNLSLLASGNGFPQIPGELLEKRNSLAFSYLDRLKQALDRLLVVAERYEVFLGAENRYHFYEMPSLEEAKLLLSEFDGSNLYYWHDVGHAEVNARLGLARSQDYLKEFKNRLAGFHLHDVRGLEDHFAPFSGEVNWSEMASYFSPETLMVIEAHSKASLKELERAIDLLKLLFQEREVENADRSNE